MTTANLPDWAHGLTSNLDARMGFEMLELSAERTVGRLPVEGNQQPFGLLHGGASAVMVETLGSMATAAYGFPEKVPVGVDLNITHLRSVTSGHITGVATPILLGGSTTVYGVEITDDEGNRTAVGRITCRLLPNRRG